MDKPVEIVQETNEKKAKEIVFMPNSTAVYVNGRRDDITPAPFEHENVVYIPLDTFARLFGMKVEKDGRKRIVTQKGG